MAHQPSHKLRRIPYPYKDTGDGRASPATGEIGTHAYMNSTVLRLLHIVLG